MVRCPRILVEKRQNFGALGTVSSSFFDPFADFFRVCALKSKTMNGLAKGRQLGHDADNVGTFIEL